MIRIFIPQAEDEYKAGQIHFSYADMSERKSGNEPERFGKIRSIVSLKSIIGKYRKIR